MTFAGISAVGLKWLCCITSNLPMVFLIQVDHSQLFVSPAIIAEMNNEDKETSHARMLTCSSAEHSQIGKYASQHGATAASQHFCSKPKKSVSCSTAKSTRKISCTCFYFCCMATR